MNQTIEVLAPAGSFQCLEAAVMAGADAVYLGGSCFGARAFADNFDEEKLIEAIEYAHLYNRKIYLTINTLFKNQELERLYQYLLPYYKAGLDAVIVQDVGVMEYLRVQFPDLAVHVSTQATVTSALSASYFKEKGVTRVVPARELKLKEIRRIKDETGLEVECFVHGALCYCYSGQCLLSSYIGGRSGNRGQCAQPCRLSYSLKGKQLDYLSLKDLCTIEMIPELIAAGIDSFKIEGRMKQPEYVYTVTKMYRKYVDLFLKLGASKYKVSQGDLDLLQNVFRRRGYTDGYYHRHNGKEMLSLTEASRIKDLGNGNRAFSYENAKIPVSGKVVLKSTTNANLELCSGEYTIKVDGEVPQVAQNRPLDGDRIKAQLSKTGNTPFEMIEMTVDMTEDLFIPLQQLNDLRRKGLEQLEEALVGNDRRTEVPFIHPSQATYFENLKEETTRDDGPDLAALVSTKEQLCVTLQSDIIDRIYVDYMVALTQDFSLERMKEYKKEVFLAMPYIFRENMEKLFSEHISVVKSFPGVLIRNFETMVWLRSVGYEGVVHSDQQMYAFNEISKENLIHEEIEVITVPQELNSGELRHLGVERGTIVVYGYQPAMITANCIAKTSGICKHQQSVLYLHDRQKKQLPVRTCCVGCYNVIYNSQPHMLGTQMNRINGLQPSALRLDFTVESGRETEKVLRGFNNLWNYGDGDELLKMDYTNGHFKRGVK